MISWTPDQLQQLLDLLKAEQYRILGPALQDEAIVYQPIDQLPVGWGDRQSNGYYRLSKRGDQSRFGYNLSPSTWKQFLFPPSEELFSYRDGELVNERLHPQKMAFIGVRACELAAIKVQDKVFNSEQPDPAYRQRRESLFLVAVNCSQAAATCFCDSTGDGPTVSEGADLVLTEINPTDPVYLVQANTDYARKLLASVGGVTATNVEVEAGELAVSEARQQMSRSLVSDDLGENLLAKLDHPHWDDVAQRCLACGNCTQVCPTCFCSTTQEQAEPVSMSVSHLRVWDSCFSEGHSYLNGGVVHSTVKSRYRQWLTHKLGSWPAQFGVSGCTGCGRCISWCPVGIDLTEEIQKLGVSDEDSG